MGMCLIAELVELLQIAIELFFPNDKIIIILIPPHYEKYNLEPHLFGCNNLQGVDFELCTFTSQKMLQNIA
jgi:hypothetical protein